MATSSTYGCDSCGYSSSKWMGFCPQCGVGDPLVEKTGPSARRPKRDAVSVPLRDAAAADVDRFATGWSELDRVLGGGLVAGSAVLLGGEPGVGKSTLLLQMAAGIAASGSEVIVASAEESIQQVALRGQRLGVDEDKVHLISDDDADVIITASESASPRVLVVDSIQTVGVAEIGSAPGGVAQVRESAARLIRHAKTSGTSVVLVGHVTKQGGLAGPKTLEHMVDVVLYLEGDPDHGFRVLRGIKNRFGPTHVAGMFDMQGDGLSEVADPSKLFLDGWENEVAGTIVYPAVEGRRAVLVEVQALVAPSNQAQPRRSVRGLNPARVNQVVAVLNRHAGLNLSDKEIYVNVVGGWRLEEPGCDLAVALALASSATDRPIGRYAAWGEIGLAGEVRSVPYETRRIEELQRMGLSSHIAPVGGKSLKLTEALDAAGL